MLKVKSLSAIALVMGIVMMAMMIETEAKPLDIYEELVGNDNKLWLRMIELIDSISSMDDGEDDSGRNSNAAELKDVKASERCMLPMRKGVCRALIPRWSYDPISKECREFKFGGCDGNGNNFSTQKQCMEQCKGL